MNEAVDDGMQGVSVLEQDGDTVIHNCFKAVLHGNQDNNELMSARFRQMVEQCNINWPESGGFGNAFKYLWEQYRDNVRTNLKTHCERRLRKYFKMRVFELNDEATTFNYFNDLFGQEDAKPYYDDIDIRNAINYAYNRRDTTDSPEREQRLGELLDELRWLGAPDDCDIKKFVESDETWFESIRMWTEIQREINIFHQVYKDRRDKPQIKNFTVVPMCSFQRRHIRIDTDVLYEILAKVKEEDDGKVKEKDGEKAKCLLPKKCGMTRKDGTTKWRNFTKTDLYKNEMGGWSLFFDMEKILKLRNNKNDFHFQLLSDGVSVSIQYQEPKHKPAEISDEEVLRQYRAGVFKYELGIDPGMRTWNATVRRCIRTKEEVSLNQSECVNRLQYNLLFFIC